MKAWFRLHWLDSAFVIAGLAIAMALRISLLEHKSIDYFNYTKIWYNTIKAEGLSAFGRDFSNYNLPYLYLLYAVIRLFPDMPSVSATKIPSIAADIVAAWFMIRIVGLRYKESPIPWFAGFAVLLAPTVVLNSAFWGQADAVYSAVLLACLYCLLLRRENTTMLLFGLALSLKAQAVFILPLVIALVLRRELRWRTLLWIPLVLILALVPALIAGRPFLELMLIYPAQAGQYEQLTLHAPSALAWIPDGGRYYPYFYSSALALAAAAALAYTWGIYRSRAQMTRRLIVELALISAILVPFLLPKMHERYFFLADLLAILLAFYIPSYFYVPLAMISISFFAYQPTLFGAEPVPIGVLALGVLVLLIILCRHTVRQLFPTYIGT